MGFLKIDPTIIKSIEVNHPLFALVELKESLHPCNQSTQENFYTLRKNYNNIENNCKYLQYLM